MIEVVTEEMHGSDRESEPEKRLRASLWLVRPFQQERNGALLFSECTDRYAQKLLDTADIVIALGKLGRGGTEDETVKPLNGIQRV